MSGFFKKKTHSSTPYGRFDRVPAGQPGLSPRESVRLSRVNMEHYDVERGAEVLNREGKGIYTFKEGDYFGEMALLAASPGYNETTGEWDAPTWQGFDPDLPAPLSGHGRYASCQCGWVGWLFTTIFLGGGCYLLVFGIISVYRKTDPSHDELVKKNILDPVKKKLTDKVEDEVKRLGQCAYAGVEDMGACLGINGLDQTRLYAMMEDSLFVYRSMYVEHISRWLKVYPAESIMVVASEHLKEAKDMKAVMLRFANFLQIPGEGKKVHHELIFKASPASQDGSVHENGRAYIGEAPADLGDKLNKIFCPKNQELAQLLLDRKLAPSVGAIPWLATALKRDLC